MISALVFAVLALALILYFTAKGVRTQSNAAVSGAANRPFYKHVLGINQKNLDGTNRQDNISHCQKGEELLLIPEPDNRHDACAVKVCRKNGEQIGYLAGDSCRMAHDLETGWTFRTTVDDVYPLEENSRKHGVRLCMKVLTMSRELDARRKIKL